MNSAVIRIGKNVVINSFTTLSRGRLLCRKMVCHGVKATGGKMRKTGNQTSKAAVIHKLGQLPGLTAPFIT